MKTQDKITAGLAAVGIIGAALLASPDADAATIFVPGTRQPGQPTQVEPHYADKYGSFDAVLNYPRDLAPLVGAKTLDQSAIAGAKALLPLVHSGDTVTGESQGVIVTDLVKRYLSAHPELGITNVTFVNYASPINNVGGFLKVTRLGPQLFGMTPHGEAADTPYNTTTYAVRYDGFADAPNGAHSSVFENPVAWLNALIGTAMYHGTAYSKTAMDDPANLVSTTVNSKGATNTYVLHTMPGYLPVVQLAQKLGLLNAKQAFGTNKTLTKIVEAAYTRPKATTAAPAPVAASTTSTASTQVKAHVKGARKGVVNRIGKGVRKGVANRIGKGAPTHADHRGHHQHGKHAR